MAGYKSKKKATEDKLTEWPKVVTGNHLTVTTHEDGRTELEWDDAALLKEVRDAIEAHEVSQLKPSVKEKATTRKKKEK